MARNLNKMSIDELKESVIHQKINVNELNLIQENQRKAFFAAIKERPNLLTKVDKENAMHFLKPALNEDPINFIYLKNEQYNDELVQIFLAHILSNDNTSTPMDHLFSIYKGLDEKIIINYNYVTNDGDELYYFDNELQVPLSIKSSFKVSLKIEHALSFIKEINVHATQLGKHKIETVVSDIINNLYRSVLNGFITKRKIGYYTLCTSVSEFEKELESKIDSSFKPYGISTSNIIVNKFAIPAEIQNQIEDQAFQIRQLKANMEADNELAKKSLDNYATKLAIEEKYPNAEHTLTEYEKDLALKRYLVKIGKNESETVNRNISIDPISNKQDKEFKKKKDIVPDIIAKKNKFKIAYFSFLLISLIINVILFINETISGGLIYLGINVALFGSIATIWFEKFKTEEPEIESDTKIIDDDDYMQSEINTEEPNND